VNPPAGPGRSETNGSYAGRDRRVSILYAGNLGPSQNLIAILKGLQKSVAAWDHLEVSIVGDGLQWSALKAGEVERLHVQGRVDRGEVAALYDRADAFLLHLADLAVYRHTVPSKIFEYAAYGRPIICGVQGEARELCARYADCYYFDSDDPASLEAAVGRFLSSASPDNAHVERGVREELARSTRAPVWQSVFSK
jgi:glycosyltransferase involved in cell wall biosynthesis